MKNLQFFSVLFGIWLATQIVMWGFYLLILHGSELERVLELDNTSIYLRTFVYVLFPLPFAYVVARRIIPK